MKYTFQTYTDSGCFSNPEGTDLSHADNLKDLRRALERWVEEVERYSEEKASLLVWKGRLSDVTDLMPDFEANLGKRGGFNLTLC